MSAGVRFTVSFMIFVRLLCFGLLGSEAFTDSDTFTLEFDESANLAPQQKAMMMASLVLVDYMFFEQDNGQCSVSRH